MSQTLRDKLLVKLKNSALGSLSRRDHSRFELRQKLIQKFESSAYQQLVEAAFALESDISYLSSHQYRRGCESLSVSIDDFLIDEVLDWLESLDYLNDQRFAEVYVRMSVAKGRGPVRIEQELRLKGVARQLLDDAMALAQVDWLDLAQTVLAKKFQRMPSDHFVSENLGLDNSELSGLELEALNSLELGGEELDSLNLDRLEQKGLVSFSAVKGQLTLKERARQIRFLQSRGFSADHIYPLFS